MTAPHFNRPELRPPLRGVYLTFYVDRHTLKARRGYSYWCANRRAWAAQEATRSDALLEGTRFAETSFDCAIQTKHWADTL